MNPFGGSREEPKTDHGTPKAIECMRRPILNNTRQKDIVYDPFLGSGTTLIAAELTDRICYGLEIDAHYCDVIVTRWQDLTGKKAILEADGRTFEQVAEIASKSWKSSHAPRKTKAYRGGPSQSQDNVGLRH